MDGSCKHINKYIAENGSKTYNMIHSYFVSCVAEGAREIKANDCHCHDCFGRKRLHACLECAYFGCYGNKCIHNHCKEFRHFFAVDTSYGAVYCFKCQDYVYPTEFVVIANSNRILESEVYGTDSYTSVVPTFREVQLVKEYSEKEGIIQGLRGIKNFGNTCYMNCIVQVLMHTPLLREYFLGEQHESLCKLKSAECMMCEIACLFQEFYSGRQSVYLPAKLVYLVKKHLARFQTIDQNDSDEFLLHLIELMCMHSRGVSNPEEEYKCKNDCDCIMHKAFSWVLKDETFCPDCSTVSNSSVLPESFIRLQIENTNGSSLEIKSNLRQLKTMQHCLEWFFTEKPHIIPNMLCETCGEIKHKRNKVSIKKLPIVACFFLQRLAHRKRDDAYGASVEAYSEWKISKIVEFDDILDMSPFMSETEIKSSSDNDFRFLKTLDKTYSLYAIVCHRGTKENGHYKSYIKINDGKEEWFECDDERIAKFDPQQINSLQGYMCFYHKRILDFGS